MYALRVYRKFAVELMENLGNSNAGIGVKPLPGQGVPTSMYVECSRTMRSQMRQTGKIAIIRAQIIDKEGGTKFLYSYFWHKYYLVPKEDAEKMIANKELWFLE